MSDYAGRLGELASDAFRLPGRASWRAQLQSATLLDQIRHADEPVPAFSFNETEVAKANDLVRLAELERSPRERRADPGGLPDVAQTYTDLARRLPAGDPRRVELLALSASTWSLAGYQANAAAIATLTAAVLVVTFTRSHAWERSLVRQSPSLASGSSPRQVSRPSTLPTGPFLAAYGLAGRACRALARFWRVGDRDAGQRAVGDLRQAASLMIEAMVVDTWALLDSLAHVVEDVIATSPWRLLRRAGSWNHIWERYVRGLALGDPPVVQVWPSQRKVLDAGLIDRGQPNLAITMPTSAGKTNAAEWAILEALTAATTDGGKRPISVYIVPSRALAGEVERHLAKTLGTVGFRVSSLFGGSEHVQYELRLIATTDVLVVTSEKFDLLLRNDGTIAERLAVVIADEGHLIGERDRGLRFELVLARVRRTVPSVRVLVLSAVLPNAHHVAAWLNPATGVRNVVAVDWMPSTLRVGVFTWQGNDDDGQHGVVRYRVDDADHDFFLPFVLTRRRKTKNLFPTKKKDIAAELALHYERLGPVLIAAPTKPSARAAAAAVMTALKMQNIALVSDSDGDAEVAEHHERIVASITEFAGADHELAAMARAGVVYHHGDVPEQVRRAIEDAYRAGALRILCATSTLGQGVNLPAKTVIVSGTHRNKSEQIPVRDFWNVAGRAARPFKETEGDVR